MSKAVDLVQETRRYWYYASTAQALHRRHGKVDEYIVAALRHMTTTRTSERIACAAAGTLVGLGLDYVRANSGSA